MYSAVFITVDEFMRAFARHLSILYRAKIHIFLLECKPKPFYIDVVKCPVFSVYTNSYVLIVRIIKVMEETLLPNILTNKVTGYNK